MYMECTVEGAGRSLGRIRLARIIECKPHNGAEGEYPQALQVSGLCAAMRMRLTRLSAGALWCCIDVPSAEIMLSAPSAWDDPVIIFTMEIAVPAGIKDGSANLERMYRIRTLRKNQFCLGRPVQRSCTAWQAA